MPKQKVEGLISNLHEKLGDSQTSPEQALLIAQMESELSSWEGPTPADGNIKTTAELLLAELEESHPKATHVVREIVEVLSHLGL